MSDAHLAPTSCIYGYYISSKTTNTPPLCHHGPQSILQYLIHPTPIDHFIDNYFDRRPLLIRRHQPHYYESIGVQDSYEQIVSMMDTRSDIIDNQSQKGPFPELTCEVFANGQDAHVKPWRLDQNQRYLATLSPAQINDIETYHNSLNHDLGAWDRGAVQFMSEHNYTLKFYKLEYHLKSLRNVCSALSNELGFGVRSNMYWTPSFSKGFPAHYDIEEAWILQIGHRKHWKVYRPLYDYCGSDGVSPFTFSTPSDLCQKSIVSEISNIGYQQVRERLYSMQQTQECSLNGINEKCGIDTDDDDIATMEFVLEPGDFLYIPRGWMHEADALEQDTHSMHITLGVYLELNADYLLKFARFMFTIKEIQSVFLKVVEIKNAEHSEDIKILRKHLLKEFEPWLRTVAFREDVLRESMRYSFHFNDDERQYQGMCELFRVYFGYFMNYIDRSALKIVMKGDNFENYIHQFVKELEKNATQRKLQRKLQSHYMKTIGSFGGVYKAADRQVRKGFKTVTMPMRADEIRKQIPTLTW